jgi:hypothetical protein
VLEPIDGINPCFAADLVDANREIVARDTCRRHAHRDRVELAADGVENRSAKVRVRRVPAIGERDLSADLGIDFRCDVIDFLAEVDERHRSHLAACQFDRDGAPDAARGARDDPYFSCHVHMNPRLNCCTAPS